MDVSLTDVQDNRIIFGQYLGKGGGHSRTIRTIYVYQYYFVFLFHYDCNYEAKKQIILLSKKHFL